jgi:hypothetical protein
MKDGMIILVLIAAAMCLNSCDAAIAASNKVISDISPNPASIPPSGAGLSLTGNWVLYLEPDNPRYPESPLNLLADGRFISDTVQGFWSSSDGTNIIVR